MSQSNLGMKSGHAWRRAGGNVGAMVSVGAAIALALVFAGCKKEQAQQMPPAVVTVQMPVEQEGADYLYFVGTTRGVEETEVRPHVAGFIDKIHFSADSQVNEGDLLFTIDQRPFQAALLKAQAELEGKKAIQKSAQINLDRVKSMIQSGAASDQELIDKTASFDIAHADVGVAQANLITAQTNLDYTEIRAPISGRIGRNLRDTGSLVSNGDPVLATIVNDSRIYADFTVSEREMLEYIRKNPLSRTQNAKSMPPVVIDLAMEDEKDFSHTGRIQSGDNRVDPDTATFGVRAVFENPDKQIAAGLSVRLRVLSGVSKSLFVPDVAVQADQMGKFVLVVGEKDMVEMRRVEAGITQGELRRITGGQLKITDRVITKGIQNARPGTPVSPQNGPELIPPPKPVIPPTTVPTTHPSTETAAPASQPATLGPTSTELRRLTNRPATQPTTKVMVTIDQDQDGPRTNLEPLEDVNRVLKTPVTAPVVPPAKEAPVIYPLPSPSTQPTGAR